MTLKAHLSGANFSGTITGTSMHATTLGLGHVANTRPSDLPISTAVSSAMTLKVSLTGANIQEV